MRILVIHPNDPSTQFLCRLYEDLPNVTKLTEKTVIVKLQKLCNMETMTCICF